MSYPAGWYPDAETGGQRYWDGNGWTEGRRGGTNSLARASRFKWWYAPIIVVAALAVISGGLWLKNQAPHSSLVYTVSGDGDLLITYSTGSGQKQVAGVPLPWSATINGSTGSITAQTTGTFITCDITVDGKQMAHQTSTGKNTVVTCTI